MRISAFYHPSKRQKAVEKNLHFSLDFRRCQTTEKLLLEPFFPVLSKRKKEINTNSQDAVEVSKSFPFSEHFSIDLFGIFLFVDSKLS